MPVAPEVRPFKKPIGRKDRFEASVRPPESSVISDPYKPAELALPLSANRCSLDLPNDLLLAWLFR
jgi:hypothetical protein